MQRFLPILVVACVHTDPDEPRDVDQFNRAARANCRAVTSTDDPASEPWVEGWDAQGMQNLVPFATEVPVRDELGRPLVAWGRTYGWSGDRLEWVEWAPPGAGEPPLTVLYDHDGDALVAATVVGAGMHGSVHREHRWTTEGRRDVWVADRGDGTVAEVYARTYDAQDRLVREWWAPDFEDRTLWGPDGPVVTDSWEGGEHTGRERWTYDAEGRQTSWRIESADGSGDSLWLTLHEATGDAALEAASGALRTEPDLAELTVVVHLAPGAAAPGPGTDARALRTAGPIMEMMFFRDGEPSGELFRHGEVVLLVHARHDGWGRQVERRYYEPDDGGRFTVDVGAEYVDWTCGEAPGDLSPLARAWVDEPTWLAAAMSHWGVTSR